MMASIAWSRQAHSQPIRGQDLLPVTNERPVWDRPIGRWPCRRGTQALARRAPGRLQDGISLWNLKESNILKMLINDSSTVLLWSWPLALSVFLSWVQCILSWARIQMMRWWLPSFHPFREEDHPSPLPRMWPPSQRRVISSCQCCQCSYWPVTTHLVSSDQAAIHLRQLNPNWPVININDAVTARD